MMGLLLPGCEFGVDQGHDGLANAERDQHGDDDDELIAHEIGCNYLPFHFRFAMTKHEHISFTV